MRPAPATVSVVQYDARAGTGTSGLLDGMRAQSTAPAMLRFLLTRVSLVVPVQRVRR